MSQPLGYHARGCNIENCFNGKRVPLEGQITQDTTKNYGSGHRRVGRVLVVGLGVVGAEKR